jgi:hypothetical protein
MLQQQALVITAMNWPIQNSFTGQITCRFASRLWSVQVVTESADTGSAAVCFVDINITDCSGRLPHRSWLQGLTLFHPVCRYTCPPIYAVQHCQYLVLWRFSLVYSQWRCFVILLISDFPSFFCLCFRYDFFSAWLMGLCPGLYFRYIRFYFSCAFEFLRLSWDRVYGAFL